MRNSLFLHALTNECEMNSTFEFISKKKYDKKIDSYIPKFPEENILQITANARLRFSNRTFVLWVVEMGGCIRPGKCLTPRVEKFLCPSQGGLTLRNVFVPGGTGQLPPSLNTTIMKSIPAQYSVVLSFQISISFASENITIDISSQCVRLFNPFSIEISMNNYRRTTWRLTSHPSERGLAQSCTRIRQRP